METTNLKGRFLVRGSVTEEKTVVCNIGNYVEIIECESLISYVKKNIRSLKKLGFEGTIDELIMENAAFEQFKRLFLCSNYSIAHEDVLTKCWIVKTTKMNSCLRVFINEPKITVPFINKILLEYGLIKETPKYQLIAFAQ